MSPIILYTVVTLSTIGILAAVILYFIAQKFKVDENPLIDEVEEALPAVNCGACGYPGCRHFAEACVAADSLEGLHCPVGGNACMAEVAHILGKDAVQKEPMIAVVRCNGTPEHCPKKNKYDGVANCAIAHNFYVGESDCAYGCLGLGDCVPVCAFDAITMDKKTELPVVVEDKCTACGACVVSCPRDIIELRKKGPKGKRVFVCCINKDKGAVARKACAVACIGCGKCVKECPSEAITLENNLAYINFEKCTLCQKCVVVCPTHAIHETNFPPRKQTEQNNENKDVKSEPASNDTTPDKT